MGKKKNKKKNENRVRTFHCDLCKGTFETKQPIEETRAESEYYFGHIPPEEIASLCDGCWELTRPENNMSLYVRNILDGLIGETEFGSGKGAEAIRKFKAGYQTLNMARAVANLPPIGKGGQA